MTFSNMNGSLSQGITFRQRWNHYLTLICALITTVIAVNFRDNALFAVVPYRNSIVGIQAFYPKNWLIDTSGEYVFRVQDVAKIGFKTTIQVTVQSVSQNTAIRNIVDALTLDRAQTLSAYRLLATNNFFVLPDGNSATEVKYTYTAISSDPFLDTTPTVVQGIDIISIRRGQAVIVTFLSDAYSFSQEYQTFDRFLKTLGI